MVLAKRAAEPFNINILASKRQPLEKMTTAPSSWVLVLLALLLVLLLLELEQSHSWEQFHFPRLLQLPVEDLQRRRSTE
jgi:cytochrome c-type biogenesis protein CcmH/NrfG